MTYSTMKAQAGERMIIKYKYIYAGTNIAGLSDGEYGSIMTSHFASVDELMESTRAMNRIVLWYQVNGGEKVNA